ncbi:MAG: C10 family peptidase, partial [Prevotella sp.]
DWFTLVRNELEIRRPILYSGLDKDNGGHEFLFTGLNTDGMVYVNWGWSGYANGWYAIDNLYIESQNVDFAYGQEMVLGLNPQKTPAEGVENTSLMGFSYDFPFSLSTNENNEILLNDFVIANFSWRLFQGTYKMVIETEEEKPDEYVIPIFEDGEYAYLTSYYGHAFSKIPSLNQMFSEEGKQFQFPVGNYRAYFLSKSIEESDWQLVRKPGGNYYCYFSVAADGTVKVDNENSLTAIHSVTAPTSSAPSAIYSLDGRKVSSSSSSNVVIMKQGNEVRKVLTR